MTNQQQENLQGQPYSAEGGWEVRPPQQPTAPPTPGYSSEQENRVPPSYPPPFSGYPPPYPGYPPPYYPYSQPYQGMLAGVGRRFVALLLDSIIVSIPTSILVGVFAGLFVRPFWDGGTYPSSPQPSWAMTIVAWGIYAWFCYAYMNGNTVGKNVMRIKLAYRDGSKLSLQTFLLHFTVGYAINALVFGLGYLWAVFDSQNQTWGQKLFKDLTVMGTW